MPARLTCELPLDARAALNAIGALPSRLEEQGRPPPLGGLRTVTRHTSVIGAALALAPACGRPYMSSTVRSTP